MIPHSTCPAIVVASVENHVGILMNWPLPTVYPFGRVTSWSIPTTCDNNFGKSPPSMVLFLLMSAAYRDCPVLIVCPLLPSNPIVENSPCDDVKSEIVIELL